MSTQQQPPPPQSKFYSLYSQIPEQLSSLGFSYDGTSGTHSFIIPHQTKFNFRFNYHDGAYTIHQKILDLVWQSAKWGVKPKVRAKLYAAAERFLELNKNAVSIFPIDSNSWKR